MSQREHTTGDKKRKHLSETERKTIERMLQSGASKAEIARALYRDKSTIKREIRRGTVTQRKRNPYESKNPQLEYVTYETYFSDAGQRVYEQNRSNCGGKNKVVKCAEMVAFVEEKIMGSEKWSPDAAIGYAKINKNVNGLSFCTKTFYN